MSAGRWTSVVVRSPSNRAAVLEALFALGAEALQERGDDLVTSLRDADEHAVRIALRQADERATIDLAPTPEVDWSMAWRDSIRAHRVGNLIVTPPWLAGEPSDAQIVIEPAMAFGTGEHETTRGVLRLMQRVIRRGDVVADLGAGSAVLSIAAVKLGARRCTAIELDPDAIGNAEANVVTNCVADRVAVVEGDAFVLLPLLAPVRVVLANIVSSVLADLLPVIAKCLAEDGRAILGGVLVEERTAMCARLSEGGWRVLEMDEEGPWWSATVAAA